MNIKQTIQLRSELDLNISRLVNNFQKQTGLKVVHLDIDHIEVAMMGSPKDVLSTITSEVSI